MENTVLFLKLKPYTTDDEANVLTYFDTKHKEWTLVETPEFSLVGYTIFGLASDRGIYLTLNEEWLILQKIK